MILLATVLIVMTSQVRSQLGRFYTASNPSDEREIITRPITNPLPNDSNRFVEVQLNNPIFFFGTRFDKIEVYIDGTIGFGSMLPKCPITRPDDVTPYLAVYWVPNNIGTVTFRQATAAQLDLDREALSVDIRNAFPTSNVQASNIKSACYVTWYNMSNTNNFNPQLNFNTFQLVLVTVEVKNVTTTFEVIVYRILSFAANHKLDGKNQECLSAALIAINHEVTDQKFQLSPIFFGRSDWVIYLTNQNDYQLIGRYAYRLHGKAGEQPFPPRINCRGDKPDPYCKAVNWFAVKAKIHKEYCLHRLPGVYSYPLACNRLVKCGFNGQREVLTCQKGLSFNQFFATCDWEINSECNIPKEAIIITETSSKKGFTPKPRQPILHENKCRFLKNGITSDPLSCSFYLLCNNARSVRFACQKGLFYNPKIKACDYKENVDCKLGTQPPTKPTTIFTTLKPSTTMTRTTLKKTTKDYYKEHHYYEHYE